MRATDRTTESRRDTLTHVGLWSVQIVLALVFAFTGSGSLTRPIEDLAAVAVWPGEVPVVLVRLIGAAELLGALGLILPTLTRIRPWLTPLAATGLAAVMLFATLYNLVHARWPAMTLNLVLGMLAAWVAWGRSRRLPTTPSPRAPVLGLVLLSLGSAGCANTNRESDGAAANVRLVRRTVEEGYNGRNPAIFDSAYHPDGVVWNNGVRLDDAPILDGFRLDMARYDEAFSEWKIDVEDIFGTADRVAVRWTFRGRVRESGRGVAQTGNWIGRIANGRIAEVWEATDEPGTPSPQPLTEAERAMISDTIRQLYRYSSQMFDSDLDCEEIVERIAPEGQTESLVAQGRLIGSGVVALLGAHVLRAVGADAVGHVRRMVSGETSHTTPGLVEQLETMAAGARVLLDSLGAGYGGRD